MSNEATILIVDADETSCLLLKEVLLLVLPRGYQILSLSNGREVVDLCRREKPKVVFTEIRLKDMDGFRLVKHIKKSEPNIPVIIQTAIPKEHVRQQACDCGCDGYLTKPLDIKKLEKFLESVFLKK